MTSGARSFREFLRWRIERRRGRLPGRPAPEELPLAEPDVALPAAPRSEIRLTWIGHSSFLIQAGGLNILTDPVFSQRVSPVSWAGPQRLVDPGLQLHDLPPIDVVIVSHDHYDHLDEPTVRGVHERSGDRVRWITPTGYAPWFAHRNIANVTELAWWDATDIVADDCGVRITALPASHWSRRGLFDGTGRKWASWSIDSGASGRIYFAGDSGYFDGFKEIGSRMGPFVAALLPIGAYEPRWFMKEAHMDPNEAVLAWSDLGGVGRLVAMHWGTFILTDEPVLEPPARLREAWSASQRDRNDLSILRHGETMILESRDDPERI